jgi:hypothetical protein
MQMAKYRHSIILALLLLFTVGAGRALAWPEAAHIKAAFIAVDYFPPAIRDLIKNNRSAFIEGIRAEKELIEQVRSEKADFSVDLLRSDGFERYVYHLQRIKFFFDKKSNSAAQVNELGMFARSALDLLEPFPAGNDFRPLEIEGHRVFFLQDFEDNFKRFDFMFDGSQYIKDLPGRLDKDLEFESTKGGLIYNAYRKGLGFRAIESDADAALNRAINLLIDQMFTMYQSRAGGGAPPFDPASFLGLDRYKKKSAIKEKQIPGPKPPTAPTTPTTPEIKKGNEKNGENEEVTQ